jgi:hypothetical protein
MPPRATAAQSNSRPEQQPSKPHLLADEVVQRLDLGLGLAGARLSGKRTCSPTGWVQFAWVLGAPACPQDAPRAGAALEAGRHFQLNQPFSGKPSNGLEPFSSRPTYATSPRRCATTATSCTPGSSASAR